jgi:HSP20 family molecular chaperone IbpA
VSDGVIHIDFVSGARVLPPLSEIALSPINIRENEAFYEIRTELPGADADNIFVGVVDDVLTIGAKTSAETQHSIGRFFAIDHRIALIEQSFALPADVDAGNLTTTFNDGALTVLLTRLPGGNVVHHTFSRD